MGRLELKSKSPIDNYHVNITNIEPAHCSLSPVHPSPVSPLSGHHVCNKGLNYAHRAEISTPNLYELESQTGNKDKYYAAHSNLKTKNISGKIGALFLTSAAGMIGTGSYLYLDPHKKKYLDPNISLAIGVGGWALLLVTSGVMYCASKRRSR